jgi:hypothetical protein
MPGELPFWIDGEVKLLSPDTKEAYVRVPNGNVYILRSDTPGINFEELKIGTMVSCEVTLRLTRVLSARIIRQ